MSDELSDELVDAGSSSAPTEVPQVVKTLSILSIIGNSLWALILLILTLWLLAASGSAAAFLPRGMGQLVGIMIVVMLVMLALHILGLVAAIKLGKGNKKSFGLYAAVTGLWAVLLLYSGMSGDLLTIISGLASAGFVVAFGMQLKNMPD